MDFKKIFDPENAILWSKELDVTVTTEEMATAFLDQDHFVFLDSSKSGGPQGGYSILAYEPALVFRSKKDVVEIRYQGKWQSQKGDPFDILGELLGASEAPQLVHSSLPFCGGAIGYFGYDLFPFIEKYKNLTVKDDLNLPDCYLGFYENALIYDHHLERWHLVGCNILREQSDFKKRMNESLEYFNENFKKHIRKNTMLLRRTDGLGLTKTYESNFTKIEYMRAVEKAIEYIYAGDIYQVNLSQRYHTKNVCAPFDLFRVLRQINPSQYGGYLQYDGHTVISSSPELFLQRIGSRIETRPIKGTRPRGETPEADRSLCTELQKSPKDLAELSMIVDLERNDLGRVCKYDTVWVDEHASIEALPTVFHTVSTVRGTLRPDVTNVELLRATFPGGSITGCPKIRSIEIIDELEPTCRNVYTGSIGFISFSGALTLNIAIRTLITKGEDIYFQVGGGIVADSDPDAEYRETLDKAAAMMEALKRVEKINE